MLFRQFSPGPYVLRLLFTKFLQKQVSSWTFNVAFANEIFSTNGSATLRRPSFPSP